MAQLKIITEIEQTIHRLADLIETLEATELYSALSEPLSSAQVWCDELKRDKKTLKDPENLPLQLDKDVKEAVYLINEATLEPSYQPQVSVLVEKLKKHMTEYKNSVGITENSEVNETEADSRTFGL